MNCSLVFSNPLPSDNQIEEFYKHFLYGIINQNKFIIQKVKELYTDVKKIDKDIKKNFGGNLVAYAKKKENTK